MVMADDDTTQERKEVNESASGGNAPKSPWKTPLVTAEQRPTMAAEAWPALSNGQQPNDSDAGTKSFEEVNSGSQQPSSATSQTSVAQPKSLNVSHRHSHGRHHKGVWKRNFNGVPPFAAHGPYYSPVFQPVVPPMFSSHVPPPGYGYRTIPPPFPVAEKQMPQTHSETPIPAFLSPLHGIDATRNIWQYPRGDPNVKGSIFLNRRPTAPLYSSWHYQQPLGPWDSMLCQPLAGAFWGPPLFGPAAALVGGPGFPGPTPSYYPPAVPASVWDSVPPHYNPHPMNPLVPMLSAETLELMEKIVKQIDYYFSDENLPSDRHLKSLMDGEGWVPVLSVATFPRVAKMTSDIQLILDALHGSGVVEVQGDKMRKRENWSNYVVAFKQAPPQHAQMTEDQSPGIKVSHSNNGKVNGKEDIFETATMCSRDSDGLAEHSGSKDLSFHEDFVHGDDNQASAGVHVSSHQIYSSNSNSKHERPHAMNDSIIQNPSETTERTGSTAYDDDMIRGPSEVAAKLDDLSNDFGCASMLDEELEMELKIAKHDGHNLCKRIENEDDTLEINDFDVERLVIVTQNSSALGVEAKAPKTKTTSTELSAAFDDGLYHYEQELKPKRSHCRKNTGNADSADGNSESPKVPNGQASSRPGGNLSRKCF